VRRNSGSRLRSNWLTTLTAIHNRPPSFLVQHSGSIEDTPGPAISFQFFFEESPPAPLFAASPVADLLARPICLSPDTDASGTQTAARTNPVTMDAYVAKGH
jgi:hypothetical protein